MATQQHSTYNPQVQSMESLIDRAEDDWGKPKENREMLVPTGIVPLDKAIYGLNIKDGELLVFQGPEKQRKTTVVVNIVDHYMQSEKPKVKPFTVIDALESGMPPSRYRDTLLSVVATQALFRQGHLYKAYCPVCKANKCTAFGIYPEFLRFHERNSYQQWAIQEAKKIMRPWPVQIYGASVEEGSTRSLAQSMVRWERLIKEFGAKIFVVDHVQQYSFETDLSDYEKQIRAIAAISDMVARYHIVCLLISQVSLTSQREAAQGTGKYYAAGGRKAAAEATSIISVNYESGADKVCITLEDSRKASAFSIDQPLEIESGCFYGEAKPSQKLANRPGMEEGASGKARFSNSRKSA